MSLYLLRIGELSLKKGSKPYFEKKLKESIKRRLKNRNVMIQIANGRFFVEADENADSVVEAVLRTTFGIAAFHKARQAAKDIEAVRTAVISEAGRLAQGRQSFKVEARRSDKSFPLTSYQLAADCGGAVLEAFPHLKVNVTRPDFTVFVEVRNKVFIYGEAEGYRRAAGGLPHGTAGKGMLLLSGGIDSPAAGYMMAKRGLALEAVHFYTPPYTSDESLDKARRLARVLAPWNGGSLKFYAVNFTPLQLAVNKLGKPAYVTLLSRACMMRVARALAEDCGGKALVTGEALAQVASQTLESLAFTDFMAGGLVLRPCVGMDKDDIVKIAKDIGTFGLSTEAEADCCSLFAPAHPVIHPDMEETKALYLSGAFEELINETVRQTKAEVIEEEL
jgi:thiamine biosynthesis protein ThiI